MSAGTAYVKRYGAGFVDKPTLTTPIDSTFLNAVEAALLQLIGVAPSADGQVAQWDNANTRFGPALILNKNVDPAAAIASSKIDFTGGNALTNAAIAGAAAIARSKLDFGSGLVNADIASAAAIALSKLADPTTGKVLGSSGGAAAAVFPPGYELYYQQITATPSKPGAVGQANFTTVMTTSSITFEAGATYMIHLFAPSTDNPGGNSLIVELHDGTSYLGEMAVVTTGAMSLNGWHRYSPGAVSKTFTVRQYNTGNFPYGVLCGAGGSATLDPCFLRITKV